MDSVEALIRERIARLDQSKVAGGAEMQASTVSRILSGNQGIPLEKLGPFLRAVGLEVMACDGDQVLVPRERLRALNLLARDALQGSDL